MASGSDWRAGDAEREAVATALGVHLAAGRLAMEEFRSRLDAVYAATTVADLTRITADLPSLAPSAMSGVPGPGAMSGAVGASATAGLRRAVTRILAAAALLALTGASGMLLLIAALLGHGGLLVPSLIVLAVPVALVAAVAGGLVWVGRRAWRSGAWLEVVPAAAGMPWLGRALWATRMLLVGRVFWRLGSRFGRPLRSRGRRPGSRPSPGAEGAVWYQAEPGGEWHQARVDVLNGTTR